jgi:hypothetical protein
MDMDLVKVVPFHRSLLKGETRKFLESIVELFKDSAPCTSYMCRARILEQSMARNRVGIGLSYRPAMPHAGR